MLEDVSSAINGCPHVPNSDWGCVLVGTSQPTRISGGSAHCCGLSWENKTSSAFEQTGEVDFQMDSTTIQQVQLSILFTKHCCCFLILEMKKIVTALNGNRLNLNIPVSLY